MKYKKYIHTFLPLLFFISVLFSFNRCKQHTSLLSRIEINTPHDDTVLNFAKAELQTFLGKEPTADNNNWVINLIVNTKMAPYSFSVSSQTKDGKQVVNLSGPNSTCVLHAAYTMLEKAGYQFEISGAVCPHELHMEKLIGWSDTVHPAVLKRGIRQHINFPMDISSYPIGDAKEYIHNLARMRFNTIVFHSYPNQWIEGPQAGTDTFAGSYFYGQRHDIPNDTLVSKYIHNKKTYCIPEIEPYIDKPAERSKRSVEWLRAVMAECKKAGMTIEFSFEPRDTSMSIANTLKTCDNIMREYPQVDDLELMTEETGKWSNKPAEANEIKQVIKTHFDADIVKEEPSLYNFQTEQDPSQVTTTKQPNIDRDYLNLLAELGHNIKAVKELDTLKKYKNLKINLGIYCVVPGYLKACLLLMNRFVPKDIEYSILPAHSAQRVANYVREAGIDKTIWQRSMLYSWIEFDGLMYLKENGITGIKMLVQQGQNVMQNAPIPGICFNHWRTAESRTQARYASLCTLYGPINETDFYREYATNLGIGFVDNYISAMQTINAADWRMTNVLPNIGFCWVGCWAGNDDKTGVGCLGYLGVWNRDTILSVCSQYENVEANLQKCESKTTDKNGKDYLSFVDNRVQASILHLKAIAKGVELQAIFKDRNTNSFTEKDKQDITKICDDALTLTDEYMKTLTEYMPDRGCEGSLISYYYTAPAILKSIREKYGKM